MTDARVPAGGEQPMTRLVIARGLPASGKTTFAKQWLTEGPRRSRVNRDELRLNLFNRSRLSGEEERTISAVQKAAVKALLMEQRDVIVDDTHLRVRHARAWANLAHRLGVDFEVIDFETDVEECVERDRKRFKMSGPVGEQAIRDLAKRFPQPWPEVKADATELGAAEPVGEHDPSLPDAIIVDLDGSLALHAGRNPYDLTRVLEDVVNVPLRLAIKHHLNTDVHVIFMTGRSERARIDTERWLREVAAIDLDDEQIHGPFMRPLTEGREPQDYEVKLRLFNEHVRGKFNVLIAYDDRSQVVDLWRSLGLTCWQVNPGEF